MILPMSDDLTMPAGYRLHSIDTIDSTNAEAMRRIAKDARAGDIIWAREQSIGRGRRGRSWHSPPGNLYVTIVVQRPPDRLVGQLAFVAANGAGEAVRGYLPSPGALQNKWPNDLMLDGKKLGGILIEGDTQGHNDNLIAVGLGLNVATKPSELKAISLMDIGVEVTVEETLQAVCQCFDRWYKVWRRDGFLPVRETWLAMAYGLGACIDVRFPDGSSIDGLLRGIDQTGALLLEQSDGKTELIATGEVFFASS